VRFADPSSYDLWAVGWRRRLDQESTSRQDRVAAVRTADPLFIPRNRLVAAALNAAMGNKISSLSKNCSMLYHGHTGTDRIWKGKSSQPVRSSRSSRRSAGRKLLKLKFSPRRNWRWAIIESQTLCRLATAPSTDRPAIHRLHLLSRACGSRTGPDRERRHECACPFPNAFHSRPQSASPSSSARSRSTRGRLLFSLSVLSCSSSSPPLLSTLLVG
jgi:hypothetical protein